MEGNAVSTYHDRDKEFIDMAVRLALEAVTEGGGPFGAVITAQEKLLSIGKNEAEVIGDPTAHAELLAIRGAARALSSRWLTGCTLYSSAEPGPMCLAACYWADIGRIVFAVSSKRAAELGLGDLIVRREICAEPSSRTIRMDHLPVSNGEDPFSVRNVNRSGLRR